ncbi:hypothetical protein D082_35090 [Synechocystis sp. PCC 6714]|nr:hypothetical protein D082_35090 [Synechocystis sp. PCC 6714]
MLNTPIKTSFASLHLTAIGRNFKACPGDKTAKPISLGTVIVSLPFPFLPSS